MVQTNISPCIVNVEHSDVRTVENLCPFDVLLAVSTCSHPVLRFIYVCDYIAAAIAVAATIATAASHSPLVHSLCPPSIQTIGEKSASLQSKVRLLTGHTTQDLPMKTFSSTG